jgi:putative SOS response-associated peptidase YedK
LGLVPYWAKDIKVGFANINAMAETVDTKPAFRKHFSVVAVSYRWIIFYE